MLARLFLGAALALAAIPHASAQTVQVVTDCTGVVAPVGSGGRLYTDQTGKLCVVGGGGGSTTTTSGAIQPPTAGLGKITQTSVTLSANTSTQLVAARATNGDRIAVEVQCDGTAAVGIDRTGGTLTSATAAPLVIPSGSYPLYTMPIATQTAITAYTGTGQACRVTEYLR